MELHGTSSEAKPSRDREDVTQTMDSPASHVVHGAIVSMEIGASASDSIREPQITTQRQVADSHTNDNVEPTSADQMEGIKKTGDVVAEIAGQDTCHAREGELSNADFGFDPDVNMDPNYVATPSVDSDTSGTDDGDSAVGGFSMQSSTMSTTSSIYEHIEENGRTYHRYKEGKYYLPNDETERDRLDLQHALFGLTFHNQLYLAPIESPQNVLDLATGTGIWAIDFANMHPNTSVLGTDLSPIQPEFVPSNCTFEIDDAEDEWTFSHSFDYIHGRALGTCFTDPGAVVAKAFNALSPGGYFELQDAIMPMQYVREIPTESSLYKWNQNVVKAAEMAGRPWTNVKNYPQYFKDAGFEDIQIRKFYWPSNAWPKGKYFKTLSMYFQQDLMEGLEGLSMKLFTNFLKWTKEEVHSFLVGVREDVQDKSIHAYVEISVVYGRKPLESAQLVEASTGLPS